MLPLLGPWNLRTSTSSSKASVARAEWPPMYQASTLFRRYARVHGALFWKSARVVSTKGRRQRRSTKSWGGMQALATSADAQPVGSWRGASGSAGGVEDAAGAGASAVATGTGARGGSVAA